METIPVPTNVKDRFDVYRFFNGQASCAKKGLDNRQLKLPLVKSFLLEHVSSRNGGNPKPVDRIFSELGCELRPVDETFFTVKQVVADGEGNEAMRPVGFVETYHERFFAFYTMEHSQQAQRRVRDWVSASPELDSSWFSSQLLQTLWDRDVSKRGDHKFGKLVFRHESIFEMPDGGDGILEDQEENDFEQGENEENHSEPERRKANFSMGDRIGRIRRVLGNLQDNYSPLYALYALRFPSRAGRGGHDLFQHGQITNRSDSFEDHRNIVRYLYRCYKSVLEATEDIAWQTPESRVQSQGAQGIGGGVPLIVDFDEELDQETFDRWVSLAFTKRNVFRLWGTPMRMGPGKVHVYGADRHLWQPIDMELTRKGIVARLPNGTCGNTFHRLLTNIQHYVSPKIKAWLGDQEFRNVLSKMPAEKEGEFHGDE